MKQFPPLPAVDDDAAPTFEGHLWLLEYVEGTPLRFQLAASGAIQFGGPDRVYRDDEAVPRPCRRGVQYVREHLDREALRAAVDDVTDPTFLGWATHRERIDYDWERLPPFLGLEVWSTDAGAFRPPAAAAAIFDRLGLDPVTTVEREVNSRDFDPQGYDLPASAWADGTAAGVVIRDKRGNRALVERAERAAEVEQLGGDDAESLADEVATDRRFERIAARLRDRGREPSVDALRDRLLADVYREEHGRLFGGGRGIDESAFRTAVARRASRFLGG